MRSALSALVLLWPALAAANHELDDRDLGSGQALYKSKRLNRDVAIFR